MQINIDPEDLRELEYLIERCRYNAKTNNANKFSVEEDKTLKRIAKMFRRELKDFYKISAVEMSELPVVDDWKIVVSNAVKQVLKDGG